ncbi:Na+/Ca+ antiporter, CaCA family [Xylanimonas cellulosilytica DSM 15894]|uniref:Na+/Ca+ antiporter, CaCA family n=1 Tax=Xylanimonas cellulosilytica (strain DSM 15894 / JCM 12276 / CECT 5975 / KCTC 9989 / LMG 20990 / NBRC 107835 / XIL07) TaxID=446471 RepID=D1BU57_XYLCX|nr:Na+/Ca+ antiporter, CaCA family [Xylanimonas cellulosilytica DSM 15894]
MTELMLVAGLIALIAGAELIVNFGTRLAKSLGISPLIIGLTIVSIGTSAPELAVGIDAMRRDAGSLVLGNIAGTNMVNLLLILGLSASIRPIVMQSQTLRLDLPAMVGSSVLLVVLASDGGLSTWDGVIMLTAAVVYTWRLLATARREASAASLAHEVKHDDAEPRLPRSRKHTVRDLLMTCVGIAVVVVGADWLVTSAVSIAEQFGVSETLIGLTVVAIGTSLPELATTITATIRGGRSIAVGNLIGSSTYNLTFILGTSLLFGPAEVYVSQQLIWLDLPLMLGAALLCVPVFLTGRRITRWEGLMFVGAYTAYLTYLIVLRA